jgi:hypothetical protein
MFAQNASWSRPGTGRHNDPRVESELDRGFSALSSGAEGPLDKPDSAGGGEQFTCCWRDLGER